MTDFGHIIIGIFFNSVQTAIAVYVLPVPVSDASKHVIFLFNIPKSNKK